MHSKKGSSQTQQPPSMQVFEDLKEHCNAPRLSSEIVLMEAIRTAHPDHLVTRTSKDYCDLLGFAAAGHATAALRTQNVDFDAARRYSPCGKRIDNDPGTLSDSVKFGCYSFQWEGKAFIFYQHAYYDRTYGSVCNLYICYQTGEDILKSGHSTDVDDLIRICGKWTHEIHKEIYVFDGYWQKSKELWKSVNGSSWDEVILDPTMKNNIIEDVNGFFDSRDLYKELAMPWKRGVIFHGHPGNGKTISIKALMSSVYARDFTVPSLYVKTLVNCNGPEYSIRLIFERARTMAPCLLIFEDLDSLVRDKVRSYFLNEVDGLEANDGILMIGSTNHLEKLDPAIAKRPSRFDRKYNFKLPGEAERVLYCEYWRKKVAKSNLVDFPEEASPIIAKFTEGFSFAYLKELFVMTLLSVARGNVAPESDIQEQAPIVNGASEGAADGESKEKPAVNGVADAESAAAKVTKRTIPDVPIPEKLRSNVLLNMARHHVQLLLDDMDNSGEDVGDVSKVTVEDDEDSEEHDSDCESDGCRSNCS